MVFITKKVSNMESEAEANTTNGN